MWEYIGSSVQQVEAGSDAPMMASVLEKLKDIDTQRISKNDDLVMKKAVLALLAVVAALESRVVSLEAALAATTAAP